MKRDNHGGTTEATTTTTNALLARPVAAHVPTAPGPAEHLRDLAARVRRLGVHGRLTPEEIVVERDDIAARLRRLARSLETAA